MNELPKRRWFQFSLRGLIIVVTLLCIGMAVISNRANRQRQAVETIRRYFGTVVYDFEYNPDGVSNKQPLPPGPDWLRTLIGVDYFANVACVADFHPPDDASLAVLDDLPTVEWLSLDLYRIPARGLSHIAGCSLLRRLKLYNVGESVDTKPSWQNARWEPITRLTSLEEISVSG